MAFQFKEIPQEARLEASLNRLSDALAQEVMFGHGSYDADEEIYLCLCHVLNISPISESIDLESRLTDLQWQTLCALLDKRLKQRVPLAYLLKNSWFAGLNFYVDERVIVPRSPLAQLIQAGFQPWLGDRPLNSVLDVCTGSGCIALAIAHYFPESQVDGLDLSLDALAVAKINQIELGLSSRVNFIHSDLFEALAPRTYDLMISNPPYVPNAIIDELPPEYLHEPRMALAAGATGLDLVDKILKQARQYLSKDGLLIVEVGLIMEAVIEKYPQLPFTWLEFAAGGEGVFLLEARDLIA